jgi:hypothetical protein
MIVLILLCGIVIATITSAASAQCTGARFDVCGIIQQKGYACEDHCALTEDGYYLKMQVNLNE